MGWRSYQTSEFDVSFSESLKLGFSKGAILIIALCLTRGLKRKNNRAQKETTLISIREQEGWREEEGERSVRAEERESALVTFEEEDLSRAFLFTFFYWFPFRFVFWNLY